MGIAGVGGYQYPNYYGVQNSGRNSGEVFGTTCTEQVAPTNLVLHGDSDEYGKVYGALGFPDGSNTAVYKSKEYTAENPVFLVAAWDADGNKTETKIDASKVDPASASLQEMMALNANRIINGEDDFGDGLMMSAGGLHGDDTLGGYEDFFAKTNWIAEMEESMNTQFMLGNYDGYLRYKKAYDIMQSISDELVKIGSEDEKNKTNDYTKLLEESARKVRNRVENSETEERNQKVVEGKATDAQLQELLKDNNERRFKTDIVI